MEENKKTTVYFQEYHYEEPQNESDEEYSDNNFIENVIDLFHDLKSRFPYFLGNRAETLFKFLTSKKSIKSVPKQFIKGNRKELEVTFTVVNTFSEKNRMKSVKESEWAYFCYVESTLR